MNYKEYFIENKEPVNLRDLKAEFVKEDYIKAHKLTIIICADVMISYNGGFLLVKRENFPAFGELWCIGGRMKRGIPLDENIREKVRVECNLELKNLKLLSMSRTCFKTDPFGHGKGTDTINFMYAAEGTGEIKLDNLHSKPTIVKKEEYPKLKSNLHPYIRDFMEMAFANIKS